MKIRKTTKEDVAAIVEMLANDKLGSQHERFQDPIPKSYFDAFEKIDADPNKELVVMENDSG